jgi:hypothetical protein
MLYLAVAGTSCALHVLNKSSIIVSARQQSKDTRSHGLSVLVAAAGTNGALQQQQQRQQQRSQ